MIEETKERPKTADEMAAAAAEEMLKAGGRPGISGPPVTASHQRAADDLEKGGGQGAMPGSTKEATGGFTSTAGGKVLDKAEDAEEEPEEEDGGEEEEGETTEKCDTKKSDDEVVDADALMKAMDALDAAAEGLEEPEVDRRAELAKALEEGTLSAEERAELLELLGAQEPTPAADAIEKSEDAEDAEDAEELVEKGFSEVFSEEFSEDYDVSPFLEKFGTTVGASLDIMREDLAKSAQDQGRFNKALAKSFRGIATVIQSQQEMIKSLSAQNSALAERLGVVEQQPVGRKSAAVSSHVRPLQKSFDGQADPTEGLSKSDIYRGLHLLMVKHKDNGGLSRSGEPIDRAVAALESGAQSISKSLLAEVKEVLS